MALRLWELHGDGRTVTPGAVVRPEERQSWGRTAGIGVQHVVAMLRGLGGAPVLGEGAIASPARTAPAAPPSPEPDPRGRPPREP